MTASLPPYIKATSNGCTLAVQAQPRSSKNQIVGPRGDALKIRITAPPVEGAANECLQEFLSEIFGIPKSRMRMVRGETSRLKVFEIPLSPEKVLAVLEVRMSVV